MSGTFGKLPLPNPFGKGGILNKTGNASPTRLVVIGGVGITLIGAVVASSFLGKPSPIQSRTAPMPAVNPLPGGPNSTPNEDRLSLRHNQEQAQAAATQGVSYTPPLAPSHPLNTRLELADADISPVVLPLPSPSPAAPRPAIPDPIIVRPAAMPAPRPIPADVQPIQHVAQTNQAEPREDQVFRAAVESTLNGWGARPGHTDVIIPPVQRQQTSNNGQEDGAAGDGGARAASYDERRDVPNAASSSMAQRLPQRVLVPAGRGVYGHTVLAVNSDTGGPIVLQADSGPIAGDRMIGAFSRAGQSDLLVVKVTSIVHDGQTLSADGVVIAPDTMQTAVASSVDQHYVSRFLLPAAAAFVQGLGQALATTSNTQSVLSPFGGASYSTRLNLEQQLGVGAGVAAGRIGAALDQSAPRNSTVNLAANASVGIMFLTSITTSSR